MDLQNYQLVCNEYLSYLQVEKRIAPVTVAGYLRAVEKCFNLFCSRPAALFLPGDWEWKDIDKRAVEIYLKHLGEEQGWKPSSVRYQASALRAFFKFLHSRGYTTRNPLKSVHPKAPKEQSLPPEGEEEAVKKMFRKLSGNLVQARLQVLLELIYGGGLKPSLVYRIKKMRVGKGYARIEWENDKKDLPLSESGLKRIREYLAYRSRSLPKKGPKSIWVGQEGNPITQAILARTVKKALEEVGLIGGGKILRQLSARHFKERGGDVRSLKQFLGVKRLGTMDRYASRNYKDVLAEFRRAHPLGKSEIAE